MNRGAEEEEEEEETTTTGVEKPSTMTLAEHEARWGFTLDELQVATKVVRTLFHNPSLFVGDSYLYESRLYTMITRDRKTKRENRDVYKAIMNEEKSRRKRFKRMQDIEAIRRTEMKREREEALSALLLPPSSSAGAEEDATEPLLLCDRVDDNGDATVKDAENGADDSGSLSASDRQIAALIGAFENVIRLEEAYAGDLNWLAISQLVAQVYRYMPHAFGSQLPPALLHGTVPAGTTRKERERFTAVVKLRIAQRCAELIACEAPDVDNNDDNNNNNNGDKEDGGSVNAGFLLGSEDVFVPDSTPMRSVPLLRRCGDLRSASPEVKHALQHVTPAADALRTLELVLVDGIADTRFVSCEANDGPVCSAEASLNLFIARRLYARRRFREWGESPFVLQTRPPVSEDEEPDTYCVFDDAQFYTAGHTIPRDDVLQLNRWLGCHTCRVRYNKLHPYYYSLCHLCGEYNFNKRLLTRDLRGKVVLLTGCRIKIGFAMALSLLRCGARLLGTTRFAHEALARFQQESDYAEWKDRLHLFSLDLRDMWVVTQFCAFVTQQFPKLFAIINNAAQTIARTREYTARVRHVEAHPPQDLHCRLYDDAATREWHQFFLSHSSVTIGEPLRMEYHPHEQPFLDDAGGDGSDGKGEPRGLITASAATAIAVGTRALGFDRYDTLAEESDHRETNSWVMRLAEVQGSEAAEVMAINALSPFIINSKLKKCLLNREGDAVPNEGRFIINVSAMEGQFYRFKQVTHPHTNMAKAALNMMTRTSGEDYAQEGIYMNSVDTGWITDESPKAKKERRAEQSLLCPLDEVDAAARCLDLIYTNSREYGKFFKDFKEIPW
ncbi:oxidoreductase-like protein [Trypanosoma grayi]|uniref:oxidoreductase-like protein n=1 Tax=Trypanosoma grayi TaxID=71804 RepID=UPI0004F48A98|nr:oxidoreductase-like protein [Trypanosoma grayi]KEG14091.1 oxidoreductase-like protein [Trypanosoma grayi]